MKNKKNKKIKFKLGNNLMIWAMIVVASFYLVQLMPNSLSTKEINYNQYRDYLLNGEIYQIVFSNLFSRLSHVKNKLSTWSLSPYHQLLTRLLYCQKKAMLIMQYQEKQ